MSLTNMFKTIGNGAPYLASKALAQTILEFFANIKQVRLSTVEIELAVSII